MKSKLVTSFRNCRAEKKPEIEVHLYPVAHHSPIKARHLLAWSTDYIEVKKNEYRRLVKPA